MDKYCLISNNSLRQAFYSGGQIWTTCDKNHADNICNEQNFACAHLKGGDYTVHKLTREQRRELNVSNGQQLVPR